MDKKERHKLWKRKYRAEHPEYVKKSLLRARKYDKTRPGRYKRDASQRYGSYIRGAKKRGYSFNLTKKYAIILFMQPCFYCGVEAEPLNGIDRVDNNKNYTESNCVPCCSMCNMAKRNKTIDEFEAWINRLCEFRRKKK